MINSDKVSAPRRLRLGDLSVSFLHPLAQALLDYGHSAAPLFKRFAISDELLAQPRARLSIARYMRLGHAAARLCQDPALGLTIGQHSRLSHAGLAGVCAAQAPDIESAARSLIRLEPLYARNYRGQSSVTEDDSGLWLNFYSISPYNAFNRFVVDSILSGWLAQLSAALGEPLQADVVEIEYPAPAEAERYSAHFNGPVYFSAGANRVHLSRAALEKPLPQHCPGTWQQLLELSEHELLLQTRTRSLRERVINLLGPLLHGREPQLSDIAKRLQLPEWTLRRRLQEEDSSFRQLLADTRRDLAMAYIRDTELSFGEIAYALGFASAEAFQRAFKRWSQLTPGQYRKTLRAKVD